ncbi:MAG: hypothetical protein FJ011_08695 [Chloroflexi bacterium]|nr:hypothetical protein [Chloroflexota bacterium]
MNASRQSQAETQRQLTILERSLAELTQAGVAETLLAPLRQQVEALRQQMADAGVQVGRDQTVQGDLLVDGDKIERQINYVRNIYRAPAGQGKLADAQVRRILDAYLRWVRDAYDQARLFGLESAPTARQTPRPDRRLHSVDPAALQPAGPPRTRGCVAGQIRPGHLSRLA